MEKSSEGSCVVEYPQEWPSLTEIKESRCKNKEVVNTLRENGWGLGFANPFASEENKILEEKLNSLLSKELILQKDIEKEDTYMKELKQQDKNIQYCIQVLGELKNRKDAEKDESRRNFSMAQKRFNFIEKEYERKCKDASEVKERNLKRKVALKKWEKVFEPTIKALEGDVELFVRVRQATKDLEKNITDRSLDIHGEKVENMKIFKEVIKLETENLKLQKVIENILLNIKEAHGVHRRLSKEFAQSNNKRKQVLNQWKRSLFALRERDRELVSIATEFYDLEDKRKAIEIRKECLENYSNEGKEAIKELDYRQKFYDTQVGSLKYKLHNLEKGLQGLQTDQSYFTMALEKLMLLLVEARNKKLMFIEEMNSMSAKEGKVNEDLQITKDTWTNLEKIWQGRGNLVNELDKLIDDESKNYDKLQRQGDQLRKYTFAARSEQEELLAERQDLIARFNNVRRSLNLMNIRYYEHAYKEDKVRCRLYRADLEISTTEIKISNILNSIVDPIYFDLQRRKNDLREKQVVLASTKNFLTKEAESVYGKKQIIIDDIEAERQKQRELNVSCDEAVLSLKGVERMYEAVSLEVIQMKTKYYVQQVLRERLIKLNDQCKNRIKKGNLCQSHIKAIGATRNAEMHLMTELMTKQRMLLHKDMTYLEKNMHHIGLYMRTIKNKYENVCGSRSNQSVDDLKKDKAKRHKNIAQEMKRIFKQRLELKKLKLRWERAIQREEMDLKAMQNVLEITRCNNESFRVNLFNQI